MSIDIMSGRESVGRVWHRVYPSHTLANFPALVDNRFDYKQKKKNSNRNKNRNKNKYINKWYAVSVVSFVQLELHFMVCGVRIVVEVCSESGSGAGSGSGSGQADNETENRKQTEKYAHT